MKYFTILVCFSLIIIVNSCNNTSEEVEKNLARINNKSWQLSRIIDSLKNQNGKDIAEIFEGNLDEEQMLIILENKLKTDSGFKYKWIEFQEKNLVVDSLENVRALMVDTINIYVDKYSKLHPEEKINFK